MPAAPAHAPSLLDDRALGPTGHRARDGTPCMEGRMEGQAALPLVYFAALQEPENHLSFSGAFRHMVRALRDAGFDVQIPGHALPWGVRLKRLLPLGRFHAPILKRPEEIAAAVAAAVARRSASSQAKHPGHHDVPARAVVFAPLASEVVPLLPPDVPVVTFSDATPRLLEGGYVSADRAAPEHHLRWDAVERAALARADRIIYASRWAATSAMRDYDVAPERISLAPFGSPLEPPARHAGARSLSSPLRLLWVGTSWDRKGGARAVETWHALCASGLDVELHMCGAAPPAGMSGLPARVIHHGFLNRRRWRHRARVLRLMREAHIFLLPTRADCSPLVLAEAAAWGLPSVTTRVGGVPEIVEDGVTGVVVDPDAPARAFADAVCSIVSSSTTYAHFVSSSRSAWEARLTWRNWAACVGRVLIDAAHTPAPRSSTGQGAAQVLTFPSSAPGP